MGLRGKGKHGEREEQGRREMGPIQGEGEMEGGGGNSARGGVAFMDQLIIPLGGCRSR